ncbi:hypothetical protein [Kribbella deserti]|uniref:DUF3995 domain-containing protein n=1 Tax=Kribbella deserti TaxID=1926257 RepID=A0ABV6QE64_9ACTN
MTEHPVPRWADRLAHAIVLMTLPSGLWRIGLALGFSMGALDLQGNPVHVEGWGIPYVLGLSVLAEALALLSFGLVRPWGEVVPRWIPWLGGRRVAPYAAVIPAALGSIALMLVWGYGFRNLFAGIELPFANDWWAALMIACYAPLLLWGPALAVLTWAYHRRRSAPDRAGSGGERRAAGRFGSGGERRAAGRSGGQAIVVDRERPRSLQV